MRRVIPLWILVATVSPRVINSDGEQLVRGADISQYASKDQLKCLAQDHGALFIRGYNPAGNGGFDPNACSTIHNSCGCLMMGMLIYMTPQPLSTKPGYIQFDEMYSSLKGCGVTIPSAWIQVTAPGYWKDVASNIAFIQSVLSRMRQYGVRPNIYTSQADWYSITGNWVGAGADVGLWYYHVPSLGSFDDFVPFGEWQSAMEKQYAQGISQCGLTINQDTLRLPSSSTLKEHFISVNVTE